MKRWLGILAVILLAIILLIPRGNPEEFVMQLNQTAEAGVGNIRVLAVHESSNYTTVHVEFQKRKDLQSPERWYIKDYKVVESVPERVIDKYVGYVYLAKKGLFSWEVVK